MSRQVPAKFTMLRTSAAVPRERLFLRLDRLREECPVTWVAAPGGAGKSVLVSSYLQARSLPCLWFQMDPADADSSGFFHALGQALAIAAPRRRSPMPLFTPEYQGNGPLFSRRYFEEMGRRLKTYTVIVFDNCEVVDAESGLWSLLSHGLRALPPGIGVVFTSRHEHPPALAYLAINGRLGSLGWEEIKVAPEEVGEIIVRQGLSPAEAPRLHEQSGGWMAGLIIMTEQMRRGGEATYAADRPPQVLFDFLAHDIFAEIPAETQRLLLRTAFLPDVSVAAAERLSGNPGAGRILAAACRRHLFTERLAGAVATYRFHPLFRAFLAQQCAAELPRAELAEVKRDSAALLAEAGEPAAAVRLLAEAEEYGDALALLLTQAPSFINQGRSRTFLALLDLLPAELQEVSPWCSYWRGIAEQPYAPAAAGVHFSRAFGLLKAADDLPGMLRCWSAVVETVFHAWDHFQQIDPWIAWLDDISPGQLADPALELQVASTMTAALTMRGGDPHSMERWARRAIAALDAVKEIYPRLGAIVYCTNYLAWVQPPGLDSAMIETTLRDAECADLPPILRLTAIYTRAALALRNTPDMRVILEEVRAALALADATGVHVWDEILFGLGVHCTLVLGERGAAESFLERMRQSVSAERRQGLAFFHYVNAWSHLVFGAVGEAREAIRKALHLYAQTGYEFPSNVAHYGAAVIYAECGELDSALAHAHRADETAKRYRAHAMRYSTLLILAYVHHKRGEPAEASTALGAALRIGRQGGHYLTLWWWYAPMMSTLAELALREGIESDHAVELVRRMRLEPADPPHAPPGWPWAVGINTLGRFELRVDGKPLDMGKKAGQRPLALLKLLCASNPEGVMASRVADLLWPDAEGDKAQHALEMALHRLRKLLRRDEAIELRGGWLRLATSLCRVDAHAFAGEVDSGFQHLAAGRHPDARSALSRGIALYRGDFLGDEGNEAWVLPAREWLSTKFLSATDALGLLYEGEGELERALALYRRTLELDGRSEPLRRRYVRCCHVLGREAEATAAEMYSLQTTDAV